MDASDKSMRPAVESPSGEYSDTVGLNHPDYNTYLERYWLDIRNAFNGEWAMKENAEARGYITVPSAMKPRFGEHDDGKEAIEYINRARYPEVCRRALDTALGKSMQLEPTIEAKDEKLKDLENSIWSDGQPLRTNILSVFSEAMITRNGGLYVNLDSAGQAKITLYTAESVVNWRHFEGKLTMLILAEEVEDLDDPFEHQVDVQRLELGLHDGYYYQRRWKLSAGQSNIWEADLVDGADDAGRFFPTRGKERLKEIPFYPIGGWKMHEPPLRALAETARDYFRCSAEFSNAMWWTANPQVVINFSDTGGFMGQEDNSASLPSENVATGADQGQDNPAMKLRWGSPREPWLLREGKVEIVAAGADALSSHKDRLEALTKEMGGLGSRAFDNSSKANIAAETQRMQDGSEGAAVWMVMMNVQEVISAAVTMVGWWENFKDPTYNFAFNQDTTFETFDPNMVNQMISWWREGVVSGQDITDYIIKFGLVPRDTRFEDIQAKAQKESSGFGDFSFDQYDQQEG